jgi:hypothetical protein
MNQDIQLWGAIAGILGFFIAVLAFLRDIFNIQVEPRASGNFLKRLVTNRRFQLIVAAILIGFSFWSLYDRVQSLEVITARQEAEITSAYITQTAQAGEFAILNSKPPSETPNLAATVQAAVAATQAAQPTNSPILTPIPTLEPSSTPNLLSTVLAVVAATQTAKPTSTLYPTYTPQPTYTPFPTSPAATSIIEIVTATFTPTPEQPPGPILAVGEPWNQGEMEAVLENPKIEQWGDRLEGILFSISVTNNKPHDISFSYNLKENFKVTDNLGKTYALSFLRAFDGITSSASDDTIKVILRAGQTIKLQQPAQYSLFIRFDIGDTSINEFIVIIKDISDIENVSWRIPVNH